MLEPTLGSDTTRYLVYRCIPSGIHLGVYTRYLVVYTQVPSGIHLWQHGIIVGEVAIKKPSTEYNMQYCVGLSSQR